jgi:hypothetical protein
MTATQIVKDFPWLRSDPAGLTGEPPPNFHALVKSHKGKWEQVYFEWLRGTTEGIDNATLVEDGKSADDLLADYLEAGAPSTKDARLRELEAKFQRSYPGFQLDIGRIQKLMAGQVKQVRDEAKAKGDKVPSEKEARKAAGRAVGLAAVKERTGAMREKLGNVNVALVVNLQLKEYQVTALQQFNLALNNLTEAKWDDGDLSDPTKTTPSPEKQEALAVLSASATAMFAAYGEVSATIGAITSLGPDTEVPREAADKLAEDLLGFGAAIAAQSDAMGRAGRLFSAWAGRVTREFIQANFAAIYPYAGAGLFALRTLATLTSAVSSSIPGYGWIGTATGAADSALEMAITSLVSWKAAQDNETQQKYALQKFEISEEHKHNLLVMSHQAKEQVTGLIDKLDDKTVGAATRLVDKGLWEAAKAANVSPTEYAEFKRGAAKAQQLAAIPGDALGIRTSLPSFSDAASSLLDLAAEQVPGGGVILAVGKIYFDAAEFYTAIRSELTTVDGVSEADVEKVRALIKQPPRNEGFQLFDGGKGVLVEAIAFPIVRVRVSGFGLSLNLKTNNVTISDQAMISREILGYAKKWAKNHPNDDQGLRHLGRVYLPDWGSWQLHLDNGLNSPFHATVSAVHRTTGKDYDVQLDLAVDLDLEECAITKSSLRLDPQGLDGKLEYNQDLPAGEKPFPITADDLGRFEGRQVPFDGTTFTLRQAMGRLTLDPGGASVSFDMTAVDEKGGKATLALSYATSQALRVEELVSRVAGPDARAEADAALGPMVAYADANFDAKRLRAKKETKTVLGKLQKLFK